MFFEMLTLLTYPFLNCEYTMWDNDCPVLTKFVVAGAAARHAGRGETTEDGERSPRRESMLLIVF